MEFTMKRRLMIIAGVINTIIFIGAIIGSLYLIYLGGKVVFDTLRLELENFAGIAILIFILSTLVTGIMLLIGIVALIFSIIMLANSKALIKKAKMPDEQFSKKKGGIVAYIIFCLFVIGGCFWFFYNEINRSVQNLTFIYVLGIVMGLLFLSIIFIIISMGKKINIAQNSGAEKGTNQIEQMPSGTEIKH